MNNDYLTLGIIYLLGAIVFYFVFNKVKKLKINKNVYWLLLAYFTSPISILISLGLLIYTTYKAYLIKSKLNKFIFWWIILNTGYMLLSFLISVLFDGPSNYGNDPAGNAIALGMSFLMQIVFQIIIIVITIIVFFVHKNYVDKREQKINAK